MSEILELIRSLETNPPQEIRGHEHRTDRASIGREIYSLVEELYPICRSITGEGLRQTLSILQRHIPLTIHEVPTGTRVFDWEIPREWHIDDAYLLNEQGIRVIDFQKSNLHVVNYSAPVQATLTLAELRPHLHSLPDKPDWIPYRTSYYNEDWGFCLTQRKLDSLAEGTYTAVIDSRFFDGSLSYGEYCLPGESSEEILFFAHCCHPSLCNDNLSGLCMLTILARCLARVRLRYSVRFVFAPATIGSIAWLARNESTLGNIKAGLVASVLGDDGHFRYKLSRGGDAPIDRACTHVLARSGSRFEILPFSPWGYDERQFCSPGLDLPIGRLTRTPNGAYPEYHTSADDLALVRPDHLAGSLLLYLEVLGAIECDRTFVNTSPKGEPQLGRRGLYSKLGGFQDIEDIRLAMLWMLNQSDGSKSLLDIAERSEMPYRVLHEAAMLLEEHGLLKPLPGGTLQ